MVYLDDINKSPRQNRFNKLLFLTSVAEYVVEAPIDHRLREITISISTPNYIQMIELYKLMLDYVKDPSGYERPEWWDTMKWNKDPIPLSEFFYSVDYVEPITVIKDLIKIINLIHYHLESNQGVEYSRIDFDFRTTVIDGILLFEQVIDTYL